MHEHERLIERFYRAFAERDAAEMAACYHPDVHFTDEVFDLRGDEAGAMWAMLCERGKDLRIEFGAVQADASSGRAHWDATYSYGPKGRRVFNSIDARFEFADGKIVRHVDSFDFWKWCRQALGAPGWLLGWSGALRNKVRQTAQARLTEYRERR